MKPTIGEAVEKYLKTTTLHGLKYLLSQYYTDRIGWYICCVASACCAGVLCAVLWDRFLNLPALLTLRDVAGPDDDLVPLVAACEPLGAIAFNFLGHVASNSMNRAKLADTFAKALQDKKSNGSQIHVLEKLLTDNDLSILQVLNQYSSECHHIMRRCRWEDTRVPCERLFVKEITPWGVCCVANTVRFADIKVPVYSRLSSNLKLDLVLNCPNGPTFHGCNFFTKYVGTEWIMPLLLAPGYTYLAELMFSLEKDSDDNTLVEEDNCVSDKGYSQRQCLLRCEENRCGCTDPLSDKNNNNLPVCNLKKIACLKKFRSKGYRNASCICLPVCKKFMTRIVLESGELRKVDNNIDPLTYNLESNVSQSVMLRLMINVEDSSMLSSIPTETWVTLLSSLGGVFNMFLGVGLFSALEFLFFLFVKLPVAIRRIPENDFHIHGVRHTK